jgi:hypothetical protein
MGEEVGGEAPVENVREVPPGVVSTQGVMAALKAAGTQFRIYEELHRLKGTPDGDAKARTNSQMAERCEGAIADLEKALDEAAAMPRARSTSASPSALFRAGFEYGALAYAWNLANDEERPRPKVEDFGGRLIAPDWAAAWAVARAQLAGGA